MVVKLGEGDDDKKSRDGKEEKGKKSRGHRKDIHPSVISRRYFPDRLKIYMFVEASVFAFCVVVET